MAGLKEFELAIDKFSETVPERVLLLQKTLAFDGLRRLINKTPVGNPSLWQSPPPPGYVGGRARANWQVTIDAPALAPTDNIDANGAATKAAGEAVILGLKVPFRTIWLSNSVPYIEALNDGHSTQAPAAFFQATIAELQSVLR